MSFIKRLKWGLEFAVYRFIEFLLKQLTIPQVHGLGSAFGRLGHRFLPTRRSIVLRNLRIALGDDHSLEELRDLTRSVFAHTGANLFCSLRTPGISSAELEEILEIRNLDVLHRLIAEGKGIILLSPHMGNWELLAQLIHWFPEGAELGTHYRPLNNPYVNTLVERQRSERGTQLFAKKASPHAMAGFLRRGGTLGILADQKTGKLGYSCSYHGRFTSCSPLPDLLARRSGAAVVSISLASLAPGKWCCTFQQVPDSSTPACMSAMELATLASPMDVFWFQDRWHISKSSPFSLPCKLYKGLDPAASPKPVRLLFWLQSGETRLPPLPEESRPDLELELACPAGTEPPTLDGHAWTKVWTTDPSVPPEQLSSVLCRIDEASIIPLDTILTLTPQAQLTEAARHHGIPVVLIKNEWSKRAG